MTADAVKTDAEWDAGDLGCGELVLDLRKRLRAMPGRVLKLRALDPGAPEDLPAWCRLTHNELIRHDPDTGHFWIRSRPDWE
jgi:tRNA 2-thiouridine synthesizing protein A